MLYYNIDPDEVRGWLFYCTPKGLKLLYADGRGTRVVGNLHIQLEKIIPKLMIDVVSIDPFIKAHGVEENDNNAIDEVCIQLLELADRFNCAVDLISHTRKGTVTPGDAESDRGASSKKDAGRLMRTLTPMSEDQAKQLNVAPADGHGLVRVDDAKVNLTARSSDVMWFRIIGVPLGNIDVDPDYPKGDNVQTVARWAPTDFWAATTNVVKNHILDKIEGGPYPGGRYSPAPNATARGAWQVVQDFCPNISKDQARKVIADLINAGVLVERQHKDPKSRSDQPSLFVGMRPATPGVHEGGAEVAGHSLSQTSAKGRRSDPRAPKGKGTSATAQKLPLPHLCALLRTSAVFRNSPLWRPSLKVAVYPPDQGNPALAAISRASGLRLRQQIPIGHVDI